MKKILQILPRILLALVVLPVIGVNLATSYIMFAPDSLPKPFYLQYAPPPPTPTKATEEASVKTQEAGSAHGEPQASHTGTASGEHGEQGGAASTPTELRPGQGIMVDTGSKIVNLVDPTGRRYLRVGVVLEFAPHDATYYTLAGEEKALFLETFNEEINEILPVINDIIITSLSTQTYESVYTAAGKEILRKQIMDTVNQQLPEHRVTYVYFTEFVVQ